MSWQKAELKRSARFWILFLVIMCFGYFLANLGFFDDENSTYKNYVQFKITKDVNFRKLPSLSSEIIRVLIKDEIIEVKDSVNNWYFISDIELNEGYVSKNYISKEILPVTPSDEPMIWIVISTLAPYFLPFLLIYLIFLKKKKKVNANSKTFIKKQRDNSKKITNGNTINIHLQHTEMGKRCSLVTETCNLTSVSSFFRIYEYKIEIIHRERATFSKKTLDEGWLAYSIWEFKINSKGEFQREKNETDTKIIYNGGIYGLGFGGELWVKSKLLGIRIKEERLVDFDDFGTDLPKNKIGLFYDLVNNKIDDKQKTVNQKIKSAKDLNESLDSISIDWHQIITNRANWNDNMRKMGGTMKELNNFWNLAQGHKDEYMLKYNNGEMDVEGIEYRIDIYKSFISEFEKLFYHYQNSNKKIPNVVYSKFLALVESLAGAELTKILMKENGEEIEIDSIYNRKKRPNDSVLMKYDDKDFEDIDEFTHYKGYLFNGVYKKVFKDKTYATFPYRFGLKHGVQKEFYKNNQLKLTARFFNDQLMEIIKEYNEDGSEK